MLSGFFFNDTATTEIYTLSLHDALPISPVVRRRDRSGAAGPGARLRTGRRGRRDHRGGPPRRPGARGRRATGGHRRPVAVHGAADRLNGPSGLAAPSRVSPRPVPGLALSPRGPLAASRCEPARGGGKRVLQGQDGVLTRRGEAGGSSSGARGRSVADLVL